MDENVEQRRILKQCTVQNRKNELAIAKLQEEKSQQEATNKELKEKVTNLENLVAEIAGRMVAVEDREEAATTQRATRSK